MEKTTLTDYVVERLKSGISPDAVKQNLLAVGWPEDEAGKAIVNGLVASGVPVPTSGARSGTGKLSSTVEVVINFFSFILLGFVAIPLGILCYQIINFYFSDPYLLRNGGIGVSTDAVHYALASIIIGFPLYVYSVRLWFKRFREDEERVESKLTKWLTYLVLLVAALTIVGDLITALFYLLQGEFSVRFLLKVLTILAIAGLVFGFYFLERKKVQYHAVVAEKTFRSFGWGVLGFVVIAIVLGFIVGGSPLTERSRGFDATRSNDLRNLAGCIGNYAYNQKALPETLADLSRSTQYSYCASEVNDPETGVPYEYTIINPSEMNGLVREGTIELCAVYALDTANTPTYVDSYSYPNDKWSLHAAGRDCDTEVVTLERPDTTKSDLPPPVNAKPLILPLQ